jgi:hypothetical protein
MARKDPKDRSQATASASTDLDPYIDGGPVAQDPGTYRDSASSEDEEPINPNREPTQEEEDEELDDYQSETDKPKQSEEIVQEPKTPENEKEEEELNIKQEKARKDLAAMNLRLEEIQKSKKGIEKIGGAQEKEGRSSGESTQKADDIYSGRYHRSPSPHNDREKVFRRREDDDSGYSQGRISTKKSEPEP